MSDAELSSSGEVLKITPTVGVVATKGNSILLVCHESGGNHKVGTYGLPAGRLEKDETEQQGARRELLEETGIDVPLDDFYEFENNYVEADVPRKNGTVEKMSWRVFRIQEPEGELRATKETIPVWLSMKQVEQLDVQNRLAPNVLNIISAALKS